MGTNEKVRSEGALYAVKRGIWSGFVNSCFSLSVWSSSVVLKVEIVVEGGRRIAVMVTGTGVPFTTQVEGASGKTVYVTSACSRKTNLTDEKRAANEPSDGRDHSNTQYVVGEGPGLISREINTEQLNWNLVRISRA